MTPTIEELARGLTEAQKRAVMALRVPDGRGKWPARHSLVDKGLLSPFPRHSWTPLGLTLRAYLERTHG